ncbi:hypothetical protein [Rubrivivax gelatinosus]|uniref:hypothetical protein n=1 Tax=Rubrivivax gelatinosus TaxID=28068 RepID=UPI0005C1FB36|nr:hypothetical protein [Rubrivivax gelatinosus]MBG6078705.1 hypothetical protein [Rubrivivax gelatinosus]
MKLFINPGIRTKLAMKHRVTEEEILQCFANRCGPMLIDDREEHRTSPPTQWFIAETDYGRKVKVCFVLDNGIVEIKTAFTPSAEALAFYQRKRSQS